MDIIKNKYYVGPTQPYETANQALVEIATALAGGDYELPSELLPDGGQINIIFKYGGLHPPLKLPNDMTGALADEGRYLIIKMSPSPVSGNVVPIISINAPSTADLATEDKLIGLDLGSNNPNVKLDNIRVEGFVMGVRVGQNCHNFYMNGCFVVNNLNVQVFIRDIDKAYITNNVIVGGEYGLVMKFVRRIRAYHNTIFLDGIATLGNEGPRAGMIMQGERLFGNTAHKNLYSIGNMIFTIGCPPVIYYDEDTKDNRVFANYNNYFAVDQPLVQLRQDSATIEDEDEVVLQDFYTMTSWRGVAQVGDLTDDLGQPIGIDANSISVHPVFIANIQNSSYGDTSIIDLSSINNSPILQKVPAWYDDLDTDYIPSDFDEQIIAIDSLLNTREVPLTAIGANDAPSANGFFGSDIFTSPLVNNIDKICDVDPLIGLTKQNIDMAFPSILAGYFYSNEREYYLYAKKGAYQLGFLARSIFSMPGFVDTTKDVIITSRGYELDEEDWDLIGNDFHVYHRKHGIVTNEDEVTIEAWTKEWADQDSAYGFSSQKTYYSYKICDGELDFILPDDYVSNAPVVITDDRVSYRDPIALCRRNFSVEFDERRQESKIKFLGNKNLIKNPQFNISSNDLYPKDWETTSNPSVFMANVDYSYIGDKCVALTTDSSSPGSITSKKIPILSGDSLSLSWHARIPQGITTGGHFGRSEEDVNCITGEYQCKVYDHHNTNIANLDGEFVATDDGYTRYYVNFGPDESIIPENISDPAAAGISGLNSSVYDIPYSGSTVSLKLSAVGTSAYTGMILIDACQAEYGIVPTTYHQDISYEHMTVEFETDDSRVFVDKRMNLSPYFNQNPNGFLYIADIPAKVWGGPEDLEVTSLHEYRWPEGRINHLPWARTHGKDKMSYRAHDAEDPTEPYGLIEPFSMPSRAIESYMIPNSLNTVQDDVLPEGISLQVIDSVGNPFSLRSYTSTVFDRKGNFPGYLSKTKFGAKEQLGATVFGQLNENGSANISYVPPPRDVVRYIGTVPDPIQVTTGDNSVVDNISFIKTKYNVNLENNGNVTVIGSSGQFHPVRGDQPVSGSYFTVNDNDSNYVVLEYPPVFGSVEAYYSGSYFTETIEVTEPDQFAVDYPNAQVVFFSTINNELPITITYLPKYAYPSPEDQDKIIFHHDRVFSGYTGPIQVDYDAELFVEITAQQPVSGEHTNVFSIVAQNPQLSILTNNSLSLEF
jgi:hypothetical protein